MSAHQTIAAEVIEVIVTNLNVRTPRGGVDVDTPLFEAGLALDSFSIVELISLLEGHFTVEFSEADFREEHFRNIGTLGKLIERYKQR